MKDKPTPDQQHAVRRIHACEILIQNKLHFYELTPQRLAELLVMAWPQHCQELPQIPALDNGEHI